ESPVPCRILPPMKPCPCRLVERALRCAPAFSCTVFRSRLTRLALAALVATAAVPSAFPAEPDSVWISSLDLAPIVQGWGKPQPDRSVTGTPLSIAGKTFDHGLGTH